MSRALIFHDLLALLIAWREGRELRPRALPHLMNDILSLTKDPLIIRLSRSAELANVWRALTASAQAAWPEVELDPLAFAQRLASALRQQGCAPDAPLPELTGALDALHTDDLYLAQAILTQTQGALKTFMTRYHPELSALTARFATGALDAEDLRQQLLEVVCVGSASREARLHKYSGRGPLYAWLRVAGTRHFIDLTRSGHIKHETLVEEDVLARMGAVSEDMELQFLKQEYRAEFKHAFAAAMRELPPQERVLLRQSIVEDLSIDALGALYGVHRATAARRLAAAKQSLFAHTREQLMRKLSIERSEFDSIMALIQSRLEASVHRLLSADLSGAQDDQAGS